MQGNDTPVSLTFFVRAVVLRKGAAAVFSLSVESAGPPVTIGRTDEILTDLQLLNACIFLILIYKGAWMNLQVGFKQYSAVLNDFLNSSFHLVDS